MRKFAVVLLALAAQAQTPRIDYPSQIRNGPFVTDRFYPTLAATCAAAAGVSISITKSWTAVPTTSCAANLVFAGGKIQPAAGATVTISGSITASAVQIFDISLGGTISITSNSQTLYPQWWGAAGNGTANDTAAILAASASAATSGASLLFLSGTYSVCSLTFSTSVNVAWQGTGSRTSTINRHSSCLQASTNMVDITTAASVSIQDMGFDMKTNGSNFQKAAVSITNSSKVNFSRNYVTGGQAVGLQCNDCDHVTHSGNYYYRNWWFGASFGSTSPTSAPVYHYGYASTGNVYEDTPIGIGFNFFLSNISVVGDTFNKSNISLTQMPNAQASVNGNVINGTATYGCGGTCGGPNFAGIFLEGVGHATASENQIAGTLGEGILCQGTYLQIPLTTGTVTQLPCNNLNINNNKIDSISSRVPILLSSASTSGTLGSQISLDHNVITNSLSCVTVVSAEGVSEANEACENSSTGGFAWTRVKRSSFRNNRGHNIGSASSGSYIGWELADSLSVNIDAFNNEMVNDGAFGMASCYKDSTLIGGAASQVRHWGNKCRGGGEWLPAPAIPTLGTWSLSDLIENPNLTGLDGDSSGWVNVTAGSPGSWLPINNLPNKVDGSYSVLYPTTPTKRYNFGTDATGTFTNSVNSGVGYIPHRIMSTTFDWIYAPTGVSYFNMGSTGIPKFSVFGGGADKRFVCSHADGTLYVGDTLGCP